MRGTLRTHLHFYLIYLRTRAIYYLENSFSVTVVNFNSVLLQKFIETIGEANAAVDRSDLPEHTDFMSVAMQEKNSPWVEDTPWVENMPTWWENLKNWLQRYHEGKMVCYPSGSKISSPGTATNSLRQTRRRVRTLIIRNMFAVVCEFKDMPWSRVEKVMEEMRPALVEVEGEFAK